MCGPGVVDPGPVQENPAPSEAYSRYFLYSAQYPSQSIPNQLDRPGFDSILGFCGQLNILAASMASNPPSSGSQSLWPHPASAPMAPQGHVPPYPMQFRPGAQTSQVPQFMPPPAAQQFHPAGQAQNLGMPPGQSQPPPFSQPMQQFLPRPAQPGHAAPSSYPQQSMPISSGMPQPTPPGHGVSFSSSYTRADASTVWKEFTTPEGRKYYYNKETKQSKWTIPDELKEAKRGMAVAGKINVTPVEEKTTDYEPIIYATKQYLMQRKKVEAEERRIRQRKAKEEFMKMLEERAKAQEEYRRNRLEFREFLESCGFIKVDSQWRKVQDLLEDDERCTRLDKLDRLEIFQEQLRRVERKNRDAFRKMMEEHIAAGTLTAKTHWRDYCQKYDEDKARIKDALKQEKEINALSTWEECKQLVEESSEYRSIGEENLCREIFDEYVSRLQEKVKEKERKREEEKIPSYLCGQKGERAGGEEKRKDKERREKEKDKERDKDRDREREKDKGKDHSRKDEEIDDVDGEESHGHKDEKRREKDKERKHRKRHQSTTDDVSSDRDDKEETKKSRKHGSDRKKSRKHAYSPESDSESRHKKHKKDRDGSRRSGGHEELEDGELGEDGEIQ
ncbi:UNVERIFIED_CONTAM: Pre-processing protein 40A [Sesamum radiatum]|uniref:Pre-processing protein 40A n=1 Tax=Sesamum radiatum TaxID=300843 RepID=A0AAW2QFC1_SESRA